MQHACFSTSLGDHPQPSLLPPLLRTDIDLIDDDSLLERMKVVPAAAAFEGMYNCLFSRRSFL
jgi:hypothetical protein